jgi:hypothetical protein
MKRKDHNKQVATGALGADLLRGCAAIAEELGWTERQVYHGASQGRLPVFKDGSVLCARKSELASYLSAKRREG